MFDGNPNHKKMTRGITLKSKLEDKWNRNIFKEKKAEADWDVAELWKWDMFDVKKRLCLGFNNLFIMCQEKSRCTEAMKLIVMAIDAS